MISVVKRKTKEARLKTKNNHHQTRVICIEGTEGNVYPVYRGFLVALTEQFGKERIHFTIASQKSAKKHQN